LPAASNHLELAITVAIANFGPDAEQALATIVRPLLEVLVLLPLIYVVKWIAKWRSWED